ncbi:MAG: TfoX/Sxy family DNA transformation protein [Tagaea sp.]|nr:TfoX/Sxy family DNA transformation protein [Tagaea sp.]
MSKTPTPFVAMCVEVLSEALGRVAARSMFGGWGLYREGRMFALIAEDTLYLKADAANRHSFEAEGLGPFVYEGKGKPVSMRYYQAPPDALDDPAAMLPWARAAYDAALRAPAPKKKGPPKRIAAMDNLGPKTQAWLGEAGILSPEDLKRAGAVAAYVAVKRRRPRDASRNLLYALHAALTGARWDKLPAADKRRLDAAAQAALAPPKKRAISKGSKR